MGVSGPRHRGRGARPKESAEKEKKSSLNIATGGVDDGTFSVASTSPPSSPAPVDASDQESTPWGGGDQAVSPRKHISLSDKGPLQKLCCCVPGLLLFPPIVTIVFTAFFAREVMVWIAAVLSVWTLIYSGNLTFGCVLGAWRMRRDVNVDWHAKLEKVRAESPEGSAFMHIVFLPNYQEDEQMMRRTLENLARSAVAHQNMYVVMCMEGREGDAACKKAANLISSSRHLFADLCATFHPASLPGDVPGKSSNCQWAYREVLQRWAPEISRHDPSQVFLTCCDADTLFHPQYFSAMTYQGLTMSAQVRAWSLWQPPILLLRNLYSSPGPTRLSGYATIIFELAGLANQKFSPHFSFSTYSFTLALASHRFVDGWDRDVIAEDHHMFCKCYFASIWEQLEELKAGRDGQSCASVGTASQMRLNPVFLPAISYLVESDDGWVASIHARFVQARRHSQGLAELSYVCLQHAHLLMSDGSRHIAKSTHARILNVAGKMATVHIIPSIHSLSLLSTLALLVLETLRWVLSMDLQELSALLSARGAEGIGTLQSFAGLKWALFAIFGPVPPLSIMMSMTTFMVVRDTLEGKLSRDVAKPQEALPTELAVPDVQGSTTGPGGMSLWQQLKLYLMLQTDYLGGALITLFIYGLFPESMAAWSLLTKNGSGFQYIVGNKPTNVEN